MVQREAKLRVARGKRPRNPQSREKPSAPMQRSLNGGGEVVLYEAPDGQIRLDVRVERDTVWLTQAQIVRCLDMSDPFTKHVRRVFGAKSVCASFARTARGCEPVQIDLMIRLILNLIEDGGG